MSAVEAAQVNGRVDASTESPVRILVREHLGADPSDLPVLSERFRYWQDVNVQAALDAYMAKPGCTSRLVGISPYHASGTSVTMSMMGGVPNLAGLMSVREAQFGGVEFERQASDVGREMTCIKTGMLLLDGEHGPLAVWIHEEGHRPFRQKGIDVLALSAERAQAFLGEMRRLMGVHNVFRGKYLKLSADPFGNVEVNFETKPHVDRDQVILPSGILESVESHAIGIGTAAPRLAFSKRHLKRGLLLYGPPGTGKTHTLRYLASQLPDYTLFVMAGSGMAWIDFIKNMAASVAPAIIVLDDVDLIAEDRELPGMAPRGLLFSLLDAMDGTKEDADILFVCTSNRADTLEKAIAARPGRIDHAIELKLPDAACRRRLFDLYGKGIELQLENLDAVIEQTEGVTASFIKELLRRAWLEARSSQESVVSDAHIYAALDQLLDPLSPLTPALLGVPPEIALQRAKQRGVGTAWCGI